MCICFQDPVTSFILTIAICAAMSLLTIGLTVCLVFCFRNPKVPVTLREDTAGDEDESRSVMLQDFGAVLNQVNERTEGGWEDIPLQAVPLGNDWCNQ